jgi:hypothetical protein
VSAPDDIAPERAHDSPVVGAALTAARDVAIAAVLLAALLIAVRIAIFGDLGSALGAVGVWGFAMALALGSRPAERTEPALRLAAKTDLD